jgi:hypothetical protein
MTMRDVLSGTLEFLRDLPQGVANTRYWSDQRKEHLEWEREQIDRDLQRSSSDAPTAPLPFRTRPALTTGDPASVARTRAA